MIVMSMIVIVATEIDLVQKCWCLCFWQETFLFDISVAFSCSTSAVCLVGMQNVPSLAADVPVALFSSSNVEICEFSR